jgi:hypothetical protein
LAEPAGSAKRPKLSADPKSIASSPLLRNWNNTPLPRTNMGSPNFTTTLLILTLVLVLLPETVHAFGAGDIPDFAFLNG